MTEENKEYLLDLMKRLGMSRVDLAIVADTHINTIDNWINGKHRIPKIVFRYLELKVKVKGFVESWDDK